MLKISKRLYYEKLDLSDVMDSNKLWNTVKLVFSNDITTRNNITLVGNCKLIISSKQSAKIFYEYFENILLDVGIKAINLGA